MLNNNVAYNNNILFQFSMSVGLYCTVFTSDLWVLLSVYRLLLRNVWKSSVSQCYYC